MASQKRSRWDSSSDDDEMLQKDEGLAIARRKLECSVKGEIQTSVPSSQNILSENITLADSTNAAVVNERINQTAINSSHSDSTESEHCGRTPQLHIPLFHGCRSVDVYRRLNFIDEGTYGMVFRAHCLATGEEVALKQVKMTMHDQKVGFPITALRETNILLALRHPNIVSVKEMVVGSSIDKVYMVMEYLENDLKSCMDMSASPFSMAEVKRLMLQLLSAVDHMHKHWYIHRDLKTSNLLYSNKGKLAVCDFGMARKYGSPLVAYTFEVITLWYRAPELLLGQTVYSTAVDMWSCGCIFGELLLRKPLFPGEGEPDQISKIFKVLGCPNDQKWPGYSTLPNSPRINTSRFPARSKLREIFPSTSFGGGMLNLSEAGFDLMNGLLTMDPKQRLNSYDAKNHPWFTEQPLPCPEEMMPKFKSRHDADGDIH